MKFFIAFLGGLIGFWIGLLLSLFIVPHEKIYIMTVALVFTGVGAFLFMFLFKRIKNKNTNIIIANVLLIICIMVFYMTINHIT